VSLLFQWLNGIMVGEPLSYHRDIFWHALLWQGITPSLVHLNWGHWGLNMLNFYAIMLLFPSVWSGWQLLRFLLQGSFFILIMLYFFSPSVHQYAGFSGLLYALVVYAVIETYQKDRWLSLSVGIFILLKLLMDRQINHLLGVDEALSHIHVTVEVHWYGALWGINYLLINLYYNNYNTK